MSLDKESTLRAGQKVLFVLYTKVDRRLTQIITEVLVTLLRKGLLSNSL